MWPRLGILLALGLSLPAQDRQRPATAEDLPLFRQYFPAQPGEVATIAIGVARGVEPVILTTGTDANGLEFSRESLLPLQLLAKLLAADAIHVASRGRLDRGSGETFGGRELTVAELLAGTALLPDYYVLDGSDRRVDAAVLRACGELAAVGKMQLRATVLGAAEFELLEGLAFAGHHRDWPSMLRTTLAPRVFGFEPLGADSLNAAQRARLAFGTDDLPGLAAARPAVLRTVLSVKDLAGWWQWRLQQQAPLWTGPRMGRLERVFTRPEEQRWTFDTTGMSFSFVACQYPTRQAGFVWCCAVPDRKSHPSHYRAQRAFEADLFGDGVDAVLADVAAAPRVQAKEVTATARAGVTRVDVLGRTRWSSPAAQGGSASFQLSFGEAKDPVQFTALGEDVPLGTLSRVGDGFTASGRDLATLRRSLWLLPQQDAERRIRLGIVMVTQYPSDMTKPTPALGASVPQYLELVPASK